MTMKEAFTSVLTLWMRQWAQCVALSLNQFAISITWSLLVSAGPYRTPMRANPTQLLNQGLEKVHLAAKVDLSFCHVGSCSPA